MFDKRSSSKRIFGEKESLWAWIAVLSTAAVAVVVDQLTKSWARSELANGRVIDIVGSLRFALTYNDGVAFGLGSGVAPLLITLAVALLAVLLVKNRLALTRASTVGAGLVLGGAAGNLCDRIFRDTGGRVVDFIDLQWWPVFNVADVCIVAGALVLVWSTGRKEVA